VGDLRDLIQIISFDRPDHRGEALAMTVMNAAFDPRYGEAWTAQQLAGLMSLPGVRLALARIEGACLGFSLSRQVIDEAELLLIATEPKWQNRGVGKVLLTDFVSHSRKSRMATLHLEVRDNNPAIEFYLQNGFEQVHRRPSYYKGRDGVFYDALSFMLTMK
jgi:[ribosomal protein S18]-alanine N-acetyltransferase